VGNTSLEHFQHFSDVIASITQAHILKNTLCSEFL
jgi:hypothetical protein